jgi:hypothetical protein
MEEQLGLSGMPEKGRCRNNTHDYARKVLDLLGGGATAIVPGLWDREASGVPVKEIKKESYTSRIRVIAADDSKTKGCLFVWVCH